MTVSRADIAQLQQILNVGPSIAANLRLIGISVPQDLVGKRIITMVSEDDEPGTGVDP